MSIDDLLYAPMNSSSSAAPTATASTTPGLTIPGIWLDVVRLLRTYDNGIWRETALAGGALRDIDLGRPIKDVDIFMPHGNVTRERLADCLLSVSAPRYAFGMYVDEVKHNPKSNSSLSNGMISPSHFKFYMDGWKFEITQKMEPFTQRSIIDSFDLGICMICLDGDKVYRSPEYNHDAQNQKITIVQQTGGREEAHAHRLKQKYNEWQIVQCP